MSYKEGWDATVVTILEAHPEVAVADFFPCPLEVPRLGGVTRKVGGDDSGGATPYFFI